jgi:hypothetical protein
MVERFVPRSPRLELAGNPRDLALFNLAIDGKLRGCQLVRLKVPDLPVGGVVRERVTITQSKTGLRREADGLCRPARFAPVTVRQPGQVQKPR